MVRSLVTMRSIRDPATGELRDSLSRDWSEYLDEIGVVPVPVANGTVDPTKLFSAFEPEVLLLTNGEDVGSHPPRDRTERLLVEAAVARDIPVLGICRGHHFLNHYYGGDLLDLSGVLTEDHDHGGTDHEVEAFDGPLADPLPDRLAVNSYHDICVTTDGIAPDLEPFAVTDEGVVEGLYHPEKPILSIQWHPERPLPNRLPVDRLITRFVNRTLIW
jgi:putative glutamine amidotransferase